MSCVLLCSEATSGRCLMNRGSSRRTFSFSIFPHEVYPFLVPPVVASRVKKSYTRKDFDLVITAFSCALIVHDVDDILSMSFRGAPQHAESERERR